jgi:hypothetical protein
MRTSVFWIALVVALGVTASAQQPSATQSGTPRAARAPAPVPTYDAQNLEARIAEASAEAREENRRVLVMWGSNVDTASQALAELTARNSEVSRKLLYEYVVVRADPAGNEATVAKLGAEVKGGALPHLTVLDADGRVLANEAAAAAAGSAAGSSPYDPKALIVFLSEHQAAYLDADPLLKHALSRAKKEQKTLFLWFSAPW